MSGATHPETGAPVGAVTLVFTDVEESTPLWERRPDAMREALQIHDRILREALTRHGGYEMRTEGDAFKAAFGDPVAAVRWCMDVQQDLAAATWPADLLADDAASPVMADGTTVMQGLRVRMGAHAGWPEPRVHPTTGRMDYDGPMVNTTARIAAAPSGGQVVVSEALWKTAGHELTDLLVRELGEFALRGVSRPVRLFQLLLPALAGREFGALRLTATAGSAPDTSTGRRLITALYATISSDGADPALLEEVEEELLASAGELGGSAEPRGDGSLTVVFGQDRAREDDPQRAVRTAIRLRELFVPLRDLLVQDGGTVPTLAVGIATVDAAGEDATTQAIEMARPLATPERITIFPTTRFLLGRLVRGREVDGGAFVVDSLDLSASARGVPGLSSPMVGRTGEMERLMRRASLLAAGQGGVVVVTGEPGVGKSRLAAELRDGLGRQVRWLEGRCPATERTPYAPFVAVFRELLGLGEEHVGVVARTKLRAGLRPLGKECAARVAPALASLLGIEPGGGWSAPEPTAVGNLLAVALRELVTAAGPTVLLVDDLHWIDAASLELLTAVTKRADTGPLLVLVTMRPEADSPAWEYALDVARTYRHRHDEIRIEALDRSDAERLTRNLLDLAELPTDLHRVVLDRCGGNPLFLEEVLRSLVQRGTVVREDGGWTVRGGAATPEIPTTVRGVVDARIDGLPVAVRRTLQHAAILGANFDRTALGAILDHPEDLDEGLGYLQRVDLVRQQVGASGLRYAFKAPLTRDSAYARIPDERRRELHRRAATEIEHRGPDPAAEHGALLAHHYEQAGEWKRAIFNAFRAVARANQLRAQELAIVEYWRILRLVDRLEGDGEAETQQVEAVLGLLSFPTWAHDEEQRARGLEALDRAMSTARRREDVPLLARLEATRGLRLQDEAAFERALEHARKTDDHAVEATARAKYGDYLGSLGYYDRAFEHIDRAIALYGGSGDERGQAMSMVSAGRCYCARAGRLDASLTFAARARDIAERLDDAHLRAWSAMEAEPLLYLGRWEDAVHVIERALPVAEEIGARWPILFASAWAAIAYEKLGRLDDADRVLTAAEREAETHAGTDFPGIYIKIARSRLELRADRPERAEAGARSAVDLARRGGYRLDEGAALRALGQARAAGGDATGAREAFEASLRRLREIESRPELGQTLLAYGEFLLTEDPARGRELVEESIAVLDDVGAEGWVAAARAALT